MKILYTIFIVAALAIIIYVYGIAFDSFSETVLVQVTPLWFFLLIFGIYGFIAEKIIKKTEQGETQSFPQAASTVINAVPLIGPIFLFPFYFIKGKSSLLVSFIGAIIWGVLLAIFFVAIFPQL
jgi:hypothetical protein